MDAMGYEAVFPRIVSQSLRFESHKPGPSSVDNPAMGG
jgi:hypothetical protein